MLEASAQDYVPILESNCRFLLLLRAKSWVDTSSMTDSRAGFVHRDLTRPFETGGMAYDNILLTEQGLRIIDAGISAIRSQVNDKIFDKYLEIERQEMFLIKDFFLNR